MFLITQSNERLWSIMNHSIVPTNKNPISVEHKRNGTKAKKSYEKHLVSCKPWFPEEPFHYLAEKKT